MSVQSDHSLLFGIVALQMDFISRDQFFKAIKAWSKDKSQQLESILIEQRALLESDRDLLLPLVARHIKAHNNDPRESLAALSGIESVAKQLCSLGDESIEATLSGVGKPIDSNVEMETAAFASDESPWSGASDGNDLDSRFRILRSHARGGLGEVYVARDMELNREVALKEIQGKFADDESSRMRFLLEAEVTGGLEHPGIVPVYGLGRYEDGRPFYAMRFIKGNSLQEAADRFHERRNNGSQDRATIDQSMKAGRAVDFDSLEFRKLLGRFIDVCQAIEYAHSRGVLHRDLKPGNIMLGKFGETLVVDWGLAKANGRESDSSIHEEAALRPASASGSAPTVMGSAIGTPAFMPPEQAAGDLNSLGPPSDVYSLGATLYYLLVGQPAFTGKDAVQVLKDVQSGKFSPPTQILPHVPKPLSAICLKSMATRPEDRYESPGRLAEDVERYLADESVSACRESTLVHARRWVRRHPAIAASTAAVILLSVVGLGLFSSILGSKNAELANLVESLRDANNREIEARLLAEKNEQTAQAQSLLAYSTLSNLVGDLQLGLRNVSGTGDLRKRILEASLPKLNAVATEFVDASIVDSETSWVLINLGDLVLELGLGVGTVPAVDQDPTIPIQNGTAAVSPIELARTFYLRAQQISEKMVEAKPNDASTYASLALAHERLGKIASRLGEPEEALTFFELSLEQATKAVVTQPDSQKAEKVLARAHMTLGDFYVAQFRKEPQNDRYHELAELHSRECVDRYELLSRSVAGDADTLQDLSLAYLRMGSVFSIKDDPKAAVNWYERADLLLEELLEIDSSNVRARRNKGATKERLTSAYNKLGNLELARDSAREACDIATRIVEDAPESVADRINLGYTLNNLALAYSNLNQWEQAKTAIDRSIVELSKVNEILQNDIAIQSGLAAAYRQLCLIQSKRQDMHAAIEARQNSIALQARLVESAPRNLGANLKLAFDYLRGAELEIQQGSIDAAIPLLEDGAKTLDSVLDWTPKNTDVLKLQTAIRFQLGQAHQNKKDYEAAARDYELAERAGLAAIENGLDESQNNINVAMAQHYLVEVKLIRDVVLGDFESLLDQPAEQLPEMLNFRADEFIHRGQFRLAARAANKVPDIASSRKAHLYMAASQLCRCASSLDVANSNGSATVDEDLRKEWITNAMAILEEAVEAGWEDLDAIENNPSFEVLQSLPEFQELISGCESEVRPESDSLSY